VDKRVHAAAGLPHGVVQYLAVKIASDPNDRPVECHLEMTRGCTKGSVAAASSKSGHVITKFGSLPANNKLAQYATMPLQGLYEYAVNNKNGFQMRHCNLGRF